jgi:hypothetical protein
MSQARFEIIGGPERRAMWGRKDEEYVADFCLVSRRALNDLEYKIFRFHFLLGAEWRLCCQKLEMERGEFFHHIYRIEQKLGRAFRDVRPYALFPLSEYFAPVVKKDLSAEASRVLRMPKPKRQRPIRPPLKKVA